MMITASPLPGEDAAFAGATMREGDLARDQDRELNQLILCLAQEGPGKAVGPLFAGNLHISRSR